MGKKDELHLLFDKIVGNEISKRRSNMNGAAQEDLARKAGVHRQWISRIESGKTSPKVFNFFRFLLATDIDVVDITRNIRDKFVNESAPLIKAAEEAKYKKYVEQTKKKRKR
jgi:predicted transcriptional regulator